MCAPRRGQPPVTAAQLANKGSRGAGVRALPRCPALPQCVSSHRDLPVWPSRDSAGRVLRRGWVHHRASSSKPGIKAKFKLRWVVLWRCNVERLASRGGTVHDVAIVLYDARESRAPREVELLVPGGYTVGVPRPLSLEINGTALSNAGGFKTFRLVLAGDSVSEMEAWKLALLLRADDPGLDTASLPASTSAATAAAPPMSPRSAADGAAAAMPEAEAAAAEPMVQCVRVTSVRAEGAPPGAQVVLPARTRSLSQRLTGRSRRGHAHGVGVIFTLELHLAGGTVRHVERRWDEFCDIREWLSSTVAVAAIAFPSAMSKRRKRRISKGNLSGSDETPLLREWRAELERWTNDALRVSVGNAAVSLRDFFRARETDPQEGSALGTALHQASARDRCRETLYEWLCSRRPHRGACIDGVVAAFDGADYAPEDWLDVISSMGSDVERAPSRDDDQRESSGSATEGEALPNLTELERFLQAAAAYRPSVVERVAKEREREERKLKKEKSKERRRSSDLEGEGEDRSDSR